MKVRVTLSEQNIALLNTGSKYILGVDSIYYNLPFFYKQIDERTFEVIPEGDAPVELLKEEITRLINQIK